MRLLGMDLSHGMMLDTHASWNTTPAPALAVADAQAIPLQDASCDVALAMHMLYHVPDIARAATELRRVLRPGGTLLAVTNGAGHTHELNELYTTAVAHLSHQQPLSLKWSDRFNLETGAELLRGAFAHVERRDAVSTLEIPDAAPLLAYLDSLRATHEPDLPVHVEWETLRREAHRLATEEIARSGVFRVRTHSGVFICR
jgi:SAM-dependent methyltransferase